MNPITVRLQNPAALIAGYGAGAKIRVQTATTETGSYADLPTAPTQVIDATIKAYTFYHLAGAVGDWYKSRIEDSGGANASVYESPFQGGINSSLCNFDDAKARILGPVTALTDTSLDEDILGYMAQADAYILGFTGRRFIPYPAGAAQTKTLYFAGTGYRDLAIPMGIRSITSVGYATTDQPSDGSGTYTAITPTRVYLNYRDENWRLLGYPATSLRLGFTAELNYFPCAEYGVKIVGQFGWASTPADIQLAALNLVVAIHRSRSASGGATVTVGIGGERVYEHMLSTMDWTTIQSYRDGASLIA